MNKAMYVMDVQLASKSRETCKIKISYYSFKCRHDTSKQLIKSNEPSCKIWMTLKSLQNKKKLRELCFSVLVLVPTGLLKPPSLILDYKVLNHTP